MVKYFKEVLGNDGKVYVCNSDDKSIAFKYADEKVISPLIYDENYIPFLLDYCRKNEIDIVISLFDIDLLMLARHKKEFEKIGTKVIVSDPEIVEVCNDKWKTYNFLQDNGFHAPLSFLNMQQVIDKIAAGELNYPIIVKPRYGCGSISVAIAYDEEDLRYLTKKANEDIANSYLKYESAVTEEKVIVRKKLAMRSGETDIAQLVDEPIIKDSLLRLGKSTKHIANMDCDVFLVDGVPYVLEMNARFGGGYPFSHMGGCNLPKAIVDWVKGKKVDKSVISAKTGITGYKEIYITEI